jgi:hypothetical protein
MHQFIMAAFALIATPAIAATPAFSPTETAAIYIATPQHASFLSSGMINALQLH